MLNIVVIELGPARPDLASCLTANGHRCLVVNDAEQWRELILQAKPDLAVIHAPEPGDVLLNHLQMLNRQLPLPVVLFTDACADDAYGRVMDAQVSVFVVDGLDKRRLPGLARLAIARFGRLQALKNALEEARAQLEDRKQIDRAKAILIKTRNFTENEAYHTLRKLAMDRNITLGEMARNVIAMADLLK